MDYMHLSRNRAVHVYHILQIMSIMMLCDSTSMGAVPVVTRAKCMSSNYATKLGCDDKFTIIFTKDPC